MEEMSLPQYTEREEKLNVITHFIGFLIGVVGLVTMLWLAVGNTIKDVGKYIDIISALLYGVSLVVLYGNSTLYHNEKIEGRRRKRQKIDHLSINLLIAGSSSAYMISGLHNMWSYITIGVIWGLSIVSMILNYINVRKYRAITMVIYVVTGWLPILLSKMIWGICGAGCFAMVLTGGLLYTAGLIFYAIKREFMHAIWHIFVLGGTLFFLIGAIIYIF